MWHGLGIYLTYIKEKDVWLTTYGYMNDEWFDRYIVSFYWSIITSLTVGYGDISPVIIFII